MNDKLNNFTQSLTKKLGSKKTLSIVLIVGLSGIVLIGLSDLITPAKKTSSSSQNTSVSVEEYINDLEKKTKEMLNSVYGAGKCKIMITAEASALQNFATDESLSQDTESDSEQSKIKNEVQKEIVMVEDSNGKKQALVKNVTEPEIRGVLVLCEGADDPAVNERITNAIKTLLGISSNKISVIKMK